MSESGNGRYKPRRKATRAASRSSRSGNRSTPPPAETTPPAPPEPPRYAPRTSDESPFWASAPKGATSSESPFWAGGNQSRPATPQYAPRGALPSYTAPDTESGLPTRPAEEPAAGQGNRRPAGGTPSWVDQSIAGTDPEPPTRARRAARTETPAPAATPLGETAGTWSSRRAADDWASLGADPTGSAETPAPRLDGPAAPRPAGGAGSSAADALAAAASRRPTTRPEPGTGTTASAFGTGTSTSGSGTSTSGIGESTFGAGTAGSGAFGADRADGGVAGVGAAAYAGAGSEVGGTDSEAEHVAAGTGGGGRGGFWAG